jgi:hypothetical protein
MDKILLQIEKSATHAKYGDTAHDGSVVGRRQCVVRRTDIAFRCTAGAGLLNRDSPGRHFEIWVQALRMISDGSNK